MTDDIGAGRPGEIGAPQPQAGWLLDPHDVGLLQYWNGTAWTEHRSRAPRPNPTDAATARASQESIWTRSWSTRTWTRIFVYGTIVAIFAGIGIHAKLQADGRSEEFRQRACAESGWDDPSCR